MGADIAIGNIQRLGLPLFMGGPHGGYFSINENLVRLMPGRLINKSTDRYDNEYYRLALQTREQHIKKSSATSNICTNQALLNNYMTAWVIENSKNGLLNKINKINNIKNNILQNNDMSLYNNYFFDTFTLEHNKNYIISNDYSVFNHNNTNNTSNKHNINISITFTDMTTSSMLDYINNNFNEKKSFKLINNFNDKNFNNDVTISSLVRNQKSIDNLLKDDIFNKFENNNLEFSRYLKELETKDFALINGMIPLGVVQ